MYPWRPDPLYCCLCITFFKHPSQNSRTSSRLHTLNHHYAPFLQAKGMGSYSFVQRSDSTHHLSTEYKKFELTTSHPERLQSRRKSCPKAPIREIISRKCDTHKVGPIIFSTITLCESRFFSHEWSDILRPYSRFQQPRIGPPKPASQHAPHPPNTSLLQPP